MAANESARERREREVDEQMWACRAEQEKRKREIAAWLNAGGPDKAARGILDRMNLPKNHRDPQGRMR